MHALDIIEDEHRSLWRILASMQAVADELAAGSAVEAGFFTALFDYIEEFMDGCHHAKEDEFLFVAMRRRAPQQTLQLIEKLEADHSKGEQALQNLRLLQRQMYQASSSAKAGALQTRSRFIQSLRTYAELLHKHIQTEEQEIFPLARKVLTEQDWLPINQAFMDNDDPLFGTNARAKYQGLLHKIVNLAPAPIGLGASIASSPPLAATVNAQARPELLRVAALESAYGRIKALKGLDIRVNEGELVALIGANGAGKTTLLRTLSGIQKLSAGSIYFEGRDISNLRADLRVRAGICHSPEGRQVFSPLSIEDNLRLGAFARPTRNNPEQLERVYDMFPILHEKRHLPAGTLSGGQQQMLAISRALMGAPKLLLLDEPSMGLAPLLVEEVFNVITRLKDQGITIFLVEQNAFAALGIADRAYVLETGKIVLQGSGAALRQDETIRAAYLGV